MVAAQAIGIARAALEFARDYAVSREAFGQPIIENQGISFPLADLAADIDSARLLTWRAAWMAAQRKPFDNAEGSMSKLKASGGASAPANRRSRRSAAGATSKTSRSRSGTATPSSARSRGHQRDPAPGHRTRAARCGEHRPARPADAGTGVERSPSGFCRRE